MFLVYYVSMVTVGTSATDWANDGLFGDGWHLLGIGSGEYDEAADDVQRRHERQSTPTMSCDDRGRRLRRRRRSWPS